MSRPVEHLSRTQRDLQRLDGRRGPPSNRAVTWGEIDALMAELAARSSASGGRYIESLGANLGAIPGEIDVGVIVSPVIDAPTGLTISSSVNEVTGISFIYVDWNDVEGASGYELGFIIDAGGEFIVPAPSSFFQNSVIAGQTISVRVRSINALNVPGPWSAYVNHIAQADTIPPPVPTGLKITPAFNGFWIEWDPSPAADIARYDILESELPTPAPTAATNPSFTSASAVFFRGSLPNGAARSYRIRAVDYSENASAWTAPITATTVVDPGELLDLLEGQITESQLFTSLGSRIDLIDGPTSMEGSVASQVAASYENSIAAVEAEAQVRADQTGSLFAQYAIKIDLNGYVSGFGLASEAPIDGTPSSAFVVRADSFSVAGTGAEPETPFIVRTVGTVIGGQNVPPGVYIRDGFIQNGTITNATIANATISDAKIASLSAAKLIAGTAIVNSVVVNGQALGTIQQNANNPAARINAASTNILPGRITISGPATLLDWTASGDRTRIEGGRIFTNSIDADAINTTSLTADSGFITNLTSTGTSFMNQLLVRTANIDDAAITTAKIGLAEVDTLRIKGNAVTVPSAQTISNAVIGNGTFQEIQWFDHTLDEDGTLLIIFSGSQGYASGNTPHLIQVRIDGVPVTERGGFFANDYPTLAYSAAFPAGTRRIAIWWSANSTVTFNSRTLIALGVKR